MSSRLKVLSEYLRHYSMITSKGIVFRNHDLLSRTSQCKHIKNRQRKISGTLFVLKELLCIADSHCPANVKSNSSCFYP